MLYGAWGNGAWCSSFCLLLKHFQAYFRGGPHTKNCQEMKLLTGPYLWENIAPKKCTILFVKMDELREATSFSRCVGLFLAFEGLLLLKHFQAYFRAGLVARCFRVLGATKNSKS